MSENKGYMCAYLVEYYLPVQYCDYWCHSRMIVIGIETQEGLGLYINALSVTYCLS